METRARTEAAHKPCKEQNIIRIVVYILVLLGTLMATPALALDPSRAIDQFGYTTWGLENGAPINIKALAQTPDGYLWIGSMRGLSRFDGVSFEQIPPLQNGSVRSNSITALLAAPNGELWVGHLWGGLSIIRNGRLENANPTTPNGTVRRIVQTRDGAIWAASSGSHLAGLRRYLNGRWDVINAGERGLPKAGLSDILAARDGTLWVALNDCVVVLRPGAQRFELVADKIVGANALTEDAAGRIWISGDLGIRPLEAPPGPVNLGPPIPPAAVTAFITDRQGELWATNQNMLVRIQAPLKSKRGPVSSEKFNPRAERPLGSPDALLEDREGNIWIGASHGLSRLRTVNVINDNHKFPITEDTSISLMPTADGDFYAIWAPNKTHYLLRNYNGRWENLSNLGASADPKGSAHGPTVCFSADKTLWVVEKNRLLQLSHDGFIKSIAFPLPRFDDAVEDCAKDKYGQFWISIYGVGLYVLRNNSWRKFDLPAEFKSMHLEEMATDSQNRILVYFNNSSMVRIDNDHTETVLSKNQIPIKIINTTYRIGNRTYLLGEGGLMVGDGERFKTLSADRFPFLARAAGVVETTSGDVWVVSAAGIVRMTRSDLDWALDHPTSDLRHRTFDFHDGLIGEAQQGGENDILQSKDGRIWAATTGSLAWIDPNHLHHNDLPPTVLIRSVFADGRPRNRDRNGAINLPAGADQLQIDYTATSLAAPEQVRFRYKLEGVDRNWVDAGSRRQAFYTNLRPGNYRFRVIAANEDGVWSPMGATQALRLPPTFIQSKAFLALCSAIAGTALWFLYRLRVNQLAARLQLRHDERMAERERIARELHDTLLQSVQGLIFRFQAAAARIPKGDATRNQIEEALDRADEVASETRDRVAHLRRADSSASLPDILRTSAERILANSRIEFHLATEGTERPLSPAVKEELASIADEFIFNTLKHSAANNLTIKLSYKRRFLLLDLSDDGRGISPEILRHGGQPGHFGLPGMNERARKIGADLSLSSRPHSGVTASLRILATRAYIPSALQTAPPTKGAFDTVNG